MQIIDLTPEYTPLYLVCLEDWSEEMQEAGDHKARWYAKMKDRGLRVKLALDETGQPGGMIQYLPIEHSPAEGKDLYFILCVWVHGYKEGRGNFQKKGMGRALLQAAEEDARALGAKGIAAWGVTLPFWMKAVWFKKQGYRKADQVGISCLVWKPFREEAAAPVWIKQKKLPLAIAGKVSVTAFCNGSCPAQNIILERAKRAAAEWNGQVVFTAIDTSDRQTFLEWGINDGLFIDTKQVNTGPPPSYEKIRKLIAKKIRKLK